MSFWCGQIPVSGASASETKGRGCVCRVPGVHLAAEKRGCCLQAPYPVSHIPHLGPHSLTGLKPGFSFLSMLVAAESPADPAHRMLCVYVRQQAVPVHESWVQAALDSLTPGLGS